MDTIERQIIDGLTWVCGLMVTLFVHDTREKMKMNQQETAQLRAELNAAKIEAAGEAARRDEMAKTLNRLETKLDDGFKSLYDRLDRKEDKS